jgi:hypothetical protein
MAVRKVFQGFHVEFEVADLVRLVLAEVGHTINPDTEAVSINVDKNGKGSITITPKEPK